MSYLEVVLDAELQQSGFPQPEREHAFHPTRKWRFDFAWPERLVAVEIEGGVWVEGRHNRGQGFIDDCEKYNEAALLGWTVLRLPGQWVEDGSALVWIKRLLDERDEIDPDQQRELRAQSARVQAIYSFVDGYINEQGVAPTYDEIGAAVGMAKSAVRYNLRKLQKVGLVDWQPGKVRTVKVLK